MFKTAALDSSSGAYVDENLGTGTEGTRLEAPDRNIIQSELTDLVESSGQTLKTSPDLTTQVPEAVKHYSGGGGDFYNDSGAANAYVLTSSGSFSPAVAYFDGMKAVFKPDFSNSTASTINIDSLGSKSITMVDGSVLAGGELRAGSFSILRFNLSDDRFEVAIQANANWPGDLIELPYEPSSGQKLSRRIIECDGSSLLRTEYPDLFAVIGVTYGNADGTHFNLPDMRGLFKRVFDNGAGIDPDAATRTDRGDGTIGDEVGTQQASANLAHDHDSPTGVTDTGTTYEVPSTTSTDDAYDYVKSAPTASVGEAESRPKNIYIWQGIFY